jgi:hypothetical protein
MTGFKRTLLTGGVACLLFLAIVLWPLVRDHGLSVWVAAAALLAISVAILGVCIDVALRDSLRRLIRVLSHRE